MIRRMRAPRRRGLTVVELILALSITALIAGAIASMMAAVSNGVLLRRDSRSVMIRATSAHGRLDAYIASSRCLLEVDGADLTLWLNDNREGGTVHASEIRWLVYDPDEQAIDVMFIDFPDTWTDVQRDLADRQFPSNSKWHIVLGQYEARGLIARVRLVDGIGDAQIEIDTLDPLDARLISALLEFGDGNQTSTIRATSCISTHLPPVS